jgi:hypothetical protein
MMKKLAGACFVAAFALVASGAIVAPAHAETAASSNIASLIETLKSLMSKVSSLQSQMQDVQKDIKETHQDIKDAVKDGLKEGMTDDDIKSIQELLASDSDIYPQGLVTGYWGHYTTDALKRFQKKHDLTESGKLDEATKDLLNEYLGQRFNGHVPAGLLRAPGIYKKVHDNICDSKKGTAWGLFCKDWKNGTSTNNGGSHTNDCAHSLNVICPSNGTGDVEITIENGKVTIDFTVDDEDHTAVSSSTRLADVYEAVADELDEDVTDLPRALKSEIRLDLAKALSKEKADARKALNDASDAIDEVQNDIDDADSDVDTEDAQDKLDEASDLYDEARAAYNDRDYDEAASKASDAEDTANDAADLLDQAIEDAN